MTADWQSARLGDVCDIYQPKTISAKEMAEHGEYPVFGANGIIGRHDQFNHENSELLITCRGATCGAVNVSLPKSWITGNAMVVRPRRGDLDRRFLEFLFRGGINISHTITGAAQPQITRQPLAPLEISYPPLAEQRRIVAILDASFAAIATAVAAAEKNLANARELFESNLNAVFAQKGDGWQRLRLEQVIESNTIGLVKSKREQGPMQPYRYVKMNNIANDNRFDDTHVAYVDASDEELRKFTLSDRDFLFNTRNSHELVGKSCVYRSTSNEPVLFNNNIMRIRFKRELNPEFEAFAFSSRAVSDQLKSAVSGTTNVAAIYWGTLKEILLAIPAIETQTCHVSALRDLGQKTQRLETLYRRKLAALAELKQSLLAKAFAGELTADGVEEACA